MSEAFMAAATAQRRTALIRATREDLLECVRIMESARLLCQTVEGLGGLPHNLTCHAKQVRERIDRMIKERL